jgi:hypothetical protein
LLTFIELCTVVDVVRHCSVDNSGRELIIVNHRPEREELSIFACLVVGLQDRRMIIDYIFHCIHALAPLSEFGERIVAYSSSFEALVTAPRKQFDFSGRRAGERTGKQNTFVCLGRCASTTE